MALAALAACADSNSTSAPDPDGTARAAVTAPANPDADDVPYDVGRPDVVFEMPAELVEISGLTVLSNGNLGAVQDEDGLLFEIDVSTGRVVSSEPFGKDGDYEGVEVTPDALWVLRSDGRLYEIRRTDDGLRSEAIETELSGRNDAEGLGYDAAGNRLLIALKDHPGKGLGDVRSVFGFDLATRTLSATPAYVLDRAVLDTETETFKPSALAVRPGTGEIYILSSVKKALLVLDADGTIRAAVSLPIAFYPQPEGIAFAPDGTLYISNEGAGGSATILRFSPR